MNWILTKRGTKVCQEPRVTIRTRGIALNSILVKTLDVNRKYCEIYTTSSQLGIKFLYKPTEQSYVVGSDGGGKSRSSNSLFIACSQLIKNNFSPYVDRSIVCVYDQKSDMWIINLIPFFINSDTTELKIEDIGVYRYVLDAEVVYIGQGVIKTRMNDNARKNWLYNKIEYFLCSKEDAKKYEKIYLDEYIKSNGRLPHYNYHKILT